MIRKGALEADGATAQRDSRRVDLVVRSDAFSKPGGDLLQAEAYAEELGKRGVDARLVPFSPALEIRRGAIVHHLNVDRFFDFLTVARAATALGAPFVVSPIHHPAAAVRALRRSQRGLSAAGAAAFLPEHLREFAAFIRRTASEPSGSLISSAAATAPLLASIRRRIGTALNRADRVMLLTEFEGRMLRADFGWHGRNGAMIPNGTPDSSGGAREGEAILVVGRIEPRKRQLEIAEAAAREGAEVGFIGAVNPNSSKYARAFETVVKRSRHLEWHGARPHAETVERMRGARVVISFGWAEVQSLVEIEAADAGCFVVHNECTGDRSWLGSRAIGLPSDAIDDAVRTAQRLTFREVDLEWRWTSSWASAAEALEVIYRDAALVSSAHAS